MANPLKWLEQLDALQSVEAIKGYLDSAVEKAGGEGSWGGAITKGLLSPAYAPVHAISGIGGLIGGAAGAVGGALSEAGQDSATDTLKAGWEGIKSGAETGAKAARENITALDIASAGAGTLAGGAAKAAKGAAALGELGKAAQLARGSRALELADLGLSGVDAAVGGSQIVSGIQEKDPLKAIMGGARIAGNVYGGVKSYRSAGEAAGFRDAANELDALIPDRVAADDVSLRERPYVDKKLKSMKVLAAPDGGTFSLDLNLTDMPGVNEHNEKQLRAILANPDRTASFSEMAGVARAISDELKQPGGAYDELHKAIEWRYTRENNPDRVPLKIITEHRRPPTLDALKKRAGEFKGFFLGGGSKGFSYVSKGDSVLRERGVGNGYWINPIKIGEQVEGHYRFLTSDENLLSPETIEKATYSYGPKVQNIIMGLKDGSIELTPEIEKTLKAEMFKRSLMYTILHEDLGHAAQDSMHRAEKDALNPAYYDRIERDAGFDRMSEMNTPLNPKTIGTPGTESDMFSIYQNRIFNEMNDPMKLTKVKAMLDAPGMEDQIVKWMNATKPLKNSELLQALTPVKRQGRTVGTAELKAAENEFSTPAVDDVVALMDQEKRGAGAKGGSGSKRMQALKSIEGASTESLQALLKHQPNYPYKTEALAELAKRQAGAAAPPVDDAVRMTMTAEQTDALDQASGNWTPPPPTPPAGGPPGVPPRPTPPATPPGNPQLDPLKDRIERAIREQNRINQENLSRNQAFQHAKMNAAEQIIQRFRNGEIHGEEMLEQIKKAYEGDHGLLATSTGMTVTPEEYDGVLAQIMDQVNKSTMEKTNIANAWQKMVGGERLQPHEVEGLKQALRVGKAEQQAMLPFWMKLAKAGENLIGGSRALMSSMDLSAAGRQALYASVTNPRETARAFKDQIAALRMSRPEFEAYMKRLSDPVFNPYADLSKAAGLHITAPHEINGMVEEAFINPQWAEKVPGVRRTEQAYITYLNKMRVELFNKGARLLDEMDIPPANADGELTQAYKDLAYMVNTLTGRGEMSLLHLSPDSRISKGLKMQGLGEIKPGEKTMDQMHRALTNVFFAPRFTASRAAILRDSTLMLMGGGNLNPEVYKMYMKNVYGTYAAIGAVAALAVNTGLGTFQADPRKSDFGNLKVGNVRYDMFGGVKQWAKLFATIESDKYWSKTYGWSEYGERPGGKTKAGEVGKFLQGKLSPPAGFLLEAITGEDFLGKKSNAIKAAYGHMIPMILQTTKEVIESGEADQLAVAVPAAALGVGVNAYKPNTGGSWRK